MKTKLSKKICQRCINEAVRDEEILEQWNDVDDERWRRGVVWCCGAFLEDDFHNGSVVRIDGIPDCCVYKLEQTVIGEKRK